MSDHVKLGATGEFPEGKLRPDDEGGLMAAVGMDPRTRKVTIDFGPKPVAWLAMDPEPALAFAAEIVKRAMALKAGAK